MMKLTSKVILPICLLGIIAEIGLAQQDLQPDDRPDRDRGRERPRHS